MENKGMKKSLIINFFGYATLYKPKSRSRMVLKNPTIMIKLSRKPKY